MTETSPAEPGTPRRRLPPGARRAAVLELLTRHPDGLPVAAVARELGLHQNTVRAHLDALVREGRAARRTAPSGRPGRPHELYTSTGLPEGDRNYRLLAEMLAARLVELSPDPAADAVEAGRTWSTREDAPVPAPAATPTASALEAQVRPVLAVLTAAGFAPRLDADGRRVELHHCPFRELALTAPDVVCGAHLGLIKGTLERSGASLDATRILPFVQPGLCVAELADT